MSKKSSYTTFVHVSSQKDSKEPSYTQEVLHIADYKMYDHEVNLASYEYIYDKMQHLVGQVLTLIDASVSDRDQRKASKDIIRSYFAEKYGEIARDLHNYDSMGDLDQSALEQVSLEDVIGK
jgi:hypothetical protein